MKIRIAYPSQEFNNVDKEAVLTGKTNAIRVKMSH
jgi:hypothetical protein